MNFKNLFFALFSILLILGCKTHTLVPNSQLKNIDAVLTHVGNRWDVRMTVQNASRMSISASNEPLLIQTNTEGNNLVATWSVNEARIKAGKSFNLLVKSESDSFPVELIIPTSTKDGYTFVMIAKVLTGH